MRRSILRPGLIASGLIASGLAASGLVPIVSGAAPGAPPPTEGPHYLTGPRAGDPVAIALEHVRGNARAARSAAGVTLEVRDHHRSPSGTTHVVLRQRVGDLEVARGDVLVNVAADGRVINVHGEPVPGTSAAATATTAGPLPAEVALAKVAEELGLGESSVEVIAPESGAERHALLRAPAWSREPIPAVLRHWADGGGLTVWSFVLRLPDGSHWWDIHADANSGEILSAVDWIHRDRYRAFALPRSDPDDGARTLEVNPADALASPFGWHDFDGDAAPDFFDTSGNNTFTQEDFNGDDVGAPAPGGPTLRFDFALDLANEPSVGDNPNSGITNLFYQVNRLHDIHYGYGFDEAAGNFQQNNYGRGGDPFDFVFADAQDGSGIDNASFAAPPDGQNGSMEMYLWSLPVGRVGVSSPVAIAGDYPAGDAEFGAALSGAGVPGMLVAALDDVTGAGDTSRNACGALSNPQALQGAIALVDRGFCTFVEKAKRVQDAGAIGAVIVNDEGNQVLGMSGTDPSVVIPSVFVGQRNGELLRATLAQGVAVTLARRAGPAFRDSSLDNGLVAHEYAHGVSSRLTGGRANASCLSQQQSAAMGEGFSDFFAIAFTARPGDAREDRRPLFAYLLGEPPTGAGVRNYPYSTDPATHPLSYADIATLNQPHGVGEVWALALWETYWNLVDELGFDPDWIGGNGGNNLMARLVHATMKLQPCEPTLVDGRDALLLAEQGETAGAYQCEIWRGFAERGIGLSADGGDADAVSVVEAFDVPVACPEPGAGAAGAVAIGALAVRRRRIRGRAAPGPCPSPASRPPRSRS